jgi:hypothetical protein
VSFGGFPVLFINTFTNIPVFLLHMITFSIFPKVYGFSILSRRYFQVCVGERFGEHFGLLNERCLYFLSLPA